MKILFPNPYLGSLLDKVTGAAIFTAAIAFGLGRIFKAAPTEAAEAPELNPDEMDTTDYLLSGPNREKILAALERRRQGNYVTHDLPS